MPATCRPSSTAARRLRGVLRGLALAASLCAASGAGAETWTLSIDHRLTGSGSGPHGQAGVDIRATGRARITAGADGRFSGRGEIAVTITNRMPPNPYLSMSPMKGTGPITVSGRREGGYLVLRIGGEPITCRGVMRVVMPTGTSEEPTESPFDPAGLGGEDITLERREGASTRITGDSQGTPFGLTWETRLALRGGRDVAAAPPKGPRVAERPDQTWRLELAHRGDMAVSGAIEARTTFDLRGSADLVVPDRDGPVSGEGRVSLGGQSAVTAPMPSRGTQGGGGTLLVEGRREGDFLDLTANVKLERATADQPGASARVDAGTGYWLYDEPQPLHLRLRGGERESTTTSTAVPGGGRYDETITWTLRGRRVERWRVTVDRHHLEYFLHQGAGPWHKRNGLRVHARQQVDVTLEDDKVTRARGRARLVRMRAYSNPPWAYQCRSAATGVVGTGTDIDAERLDQAHWAKRFNPPKNAHDAKLAAQWSAIMARKTPFVFPETFTPGAGLAGRSLTVTLPEPSGYVVGIYCKLDVKAVQAHGFSVGKSTRVETMGHQRRVFQPSRVTVELRDGWTKADAPADAVDRMVLQVERLR